MLHTDSCQAAVVGWMSGPPKPGNPSNSSVVERRSVVEVGTPSVVGLRHEEWVDGVWWLNKEMVKQDDKYLG